MRIVLVVLLIAGLVWFFHGTGGKESGSGRNAPVTVSVAAARKGDINIYLDGLGNVTPPYTVTLHSRVDGQLMQVLFKEGQFVKKDQPLAELDARPYQAQLEQAEGQLMRDQALLDEAKIDLKRYKTLIAQDSIARQQYDTQVSLVKQYEGAAKNDQGQVDNAKLQIIYTKITAPFGGRVGLRQIDPGNIVHASDANGVAVITQLQPITALFTVSEDNIPAVMQRMQDKEDIIAEAWDREGKKLLATGKIVAVDNQVDPTTGTVKLRAEFPNEDNTLFPSQFVNIRCHLDTKKDVLLVPASAVQQGSNGSFVYLVKQEDSTVTVKPVKVDSTEGERTAIASGLSEGDTVVTDGSDNLREGAKIIVPVPKDASVPSDNASPADEQKKLHGHHKKDDQ